MLAGSTTDIGSVPILAVHDGCSAVSASRATQSRICSSVATSGPGASSPPLNWSNAGWLRMFLAMRIASTHSLRSWCGRHIVESQRRVHGRVARGDLDRAPGVRIHRPDVHLVTMAAGRRGTVVADGDRQEVEHQVRIAHVLVAPDESARLEVVRRPWAVTQEQPPGADARAVAPLERGGDRHRELGRELDIDLEVILEVRADAGQVSRPCPRPAGSGRSRCRRRKAGATAAS